MIRWVHGLLFALLALTGTSTAWASGRWQELTPQQRIALAPLKTQWDALDTDRRGKWLEVAARFPSLSPAERERMQTRMSEWAGKTPADRGAARLQFQEAQRWTPQERQERWEEYQSLDPQARLVLANRWKLEAAAQASRPPGSSTTDKRNIVETSAPAVLPRRPATPTSERARSGATTQPMSRSRTEPAHHQPGLPKIAATPTFVDPTTLLPKRGPQGAAVAGRPASAPDID